MLCPGRTSEPSLVFVSISLTINCIPAGWMVKEIKRVKSHLLLNRSRGPAGCVIVLRTEGLGFHQGSVGNRYEWSQFSAH